MVFTADHLSSLSRRELQALAKEAGVSAGVSSATIVANLLSLAAPPSVAAAAVEEPEREAAAPDAAAAGGSLEVFEVAAGAACEAQIDGRWTEAIVVRVNKKTVRVRRLEDGEESTVKMEEVRSRSSASAVAPAATEEQQEEQEVEEDAGFSGLNMSMEAYQTTQEPEPETIDWLAACCEDAPEATGNAPNKAAHRGKKSITASMHSARPAWNSTTKPTSSRPTSAKVRKSSIVVTAAAAAAAAAPEPAAVDQHAPASSTISEAAPAAAPRRKSFSASGTNPCKTAPAIVPRLNKAAQLMLEARKKKMDAERLDALSAAPVLAPFAVGTVSAPAPAAAAAAASSRKMSIMPRVAAPVALAKKPSAPGAPSSSSAGAFKPKMFVARPMPVFSALHKQNPGKAAPSSSSSSAAVEAKENAPQPASTKAVFSGSDATKKADKLHAKIADTKGKRESLFAAKRHMAPAPVAMPAAAVVHVAPPVGPHGPFSSLLK